MLLLLLKKIDIHVVLMFKSVHWQMKMYFYIQLDWGEDLFGIFLGNFVFYSLYTGYYFFKGNPSHI